jgi:ribosomal protein L37E
MALTTCPECGKEISDQADLCPHCGYAVRRIRVEATVKRYKRHMLVWFLFLFSGGIIFVRGVSNHIDALQMSLGFLLGFVGFLGMIVSAAVGWWKHA